MHSIWQEKEQKEKKLWKALAFLSKPFLLRLPKDTTSPEAEISKQIQWTLRHQKEMHNLAHRRKLIILPGDHPLKMIAAKMGKEAGIHVHSVFLDAGAPCFHNATIRDDGRGNAAITFHGDPLLQENGEVLCRAVTGHEIAHAVLNNTWRNRHVYEQETKKLTRPYLLLATLFASAFPLLPVASVVTAGALVLTGAFGPAALRQAYRRNNEYMADIKGAEITGSATEAVQNLQYLKRVDVNKKAEHPDLLRSPGQRLMETFIGSTHPPMSERIGTLQKAFNLENTPEEPPVAEMPVTPEERFRMSIDCEQLHWL